MTEYFAYTGTLSLCRETQSILDNIGYNIQSEQWKLSKNTGLNKGFQLYYWERTLNYYKNCLTPIIDESRKYMRENPSPNKFTNQIRCFITANIMLGNLYTNMNFQNFANANKGLFWYIAAYNIISAMPDLDKSSKLSKMLRKVLNSIYKNYYNRISNTHAIYDQNKKNHAFYAMQAYRWYNKLPSYKQKNILIKVLDTLFVAIEYMEDKHAAANAISFLTHYYPGNDKTIEFMMLKAKMDVI